MLAGLAGAESSPAPGDERHHPARLEKACGGLPKRVTGSAMGAERDRVAGFGRLEDGLRQAGEWYRWGPYVSERQWGTVREDYSADGEAWDYLPHDQARSRAYRWGEDGLAGFCDVEQRLCLGLALWNGKDPILKERAFGLTGAQGNHGEDVKEYWWYLDALPSHAWNRWRYHYPQGAFPYQDLIDVRTGRGTACQPEYELLDTGVVRRRPVLDHRSALRQGQRRRPADDRPGDQRRPRGRDAARAADRLVPQHLVLGRRRAQAGHARRRAIRRWASTTRSSARLELLAGPGPDGTMPTAVFCENETNDREAVRLHAAHAVPEGRHQRPRGQRGGHRQPGAHGHQVRVLVPGDGRSREQRSSCACGCAAARPGRPSGTAQRPARRAVHQGDASAQGRGRRVLRRADPARGDRRRGAW